ncbi:MAG TPA: hypothetical protein PLH19_14075 [Anaerolineae bacterium]|nr:hypothetical protein [Anaerolineae bacterium]HQH39643.1 hypothetical protein [Anaerolineae bacterium]
MQKWKLISVFVLLGLLLSSGINIALGQVNGFGQNKQESKAFSLRTEAVHTALAHNALFDCANYYPAGDAILPTEEQIFHINREIKITPDDGKDYRGAVWSPDGTAIVFVAPTDEQRPIQANDALPSDDETRLMAVSKNELLLYFPGQDIWEPIASDGTRPVWSADSHSIYYMAGVDLMKFNLTNKTTNRTELKAPDTGNGLLFSRPLSDGRLLAPRHPHTPLVVQGGVSALAQIEVAENDYVLLSPSEDNAVVTYGSNTWKGEFTPSVAVLYHSTKGTIPLFKNCQYSALETVWSPDSSRIAYPVHSSQPEIRIYDIESGQIHIPIRLDGFDQLSGLSWSPDGRFLAFTQGDGRSQSRSIGIISTDGTKQQTLVYDGLLPNWSPDGQYILYARPASHQTLDWYLLDITTAKR